MQGKKTLFRKTFQTILVKRLYAGGKFLSPPERNIDLEWLYNATKKYYGAEGQHRCWAHW